MESDSLIAFSGWLASGASRNNDFGWVAPPRIISEGGSGSGRRHLCWLLDHLGQAAATILDSTDRQVNVRTRPPSGVDDLRQTVADLVARVRLLARRVRV